MLNTVQGDITKITDIEAIVNAANPKYLIYIRGNKLNPLGVLDKLMEYGGKSGDYTTADLMTSSNLFYIDYKKNNVITFERDNTMLAEAIINNL